MKLIIDNNIFFSLLKPDSAAFSIFKEKNIEFYAPSFIKEEFSKYKELCFSKSGLSKELFNKQLKLVRSKITFIELDTYRKFIAKTAPLISDKKDIPYLASAITVKAAIWSNDKHFKQQNKITCLTTYELVKLLN